MRVVGVRVKVRVRVRVRVRVGVRARLQVFVRVVLGECDEGRHATGTHQPHLVTIRVRDRNS